MNSNQSRYHNIFLYHHSVFQEKFNALESKMIPRGDRGVFVDDEDDGGEVYGARGNIKQVVQAGDENQFVDIEGGSCWAEKGCVNV